MNGEYMLSTIDNPYDPFEQFIQWFMFDIEKQHYTCSKLARLLNITEEMSDVEINHEIDKAIDKLIELDFTNTFIRVYNKQN
jgi:hypothetical protein